MRPLAAVRVVTLAQNVPGPVAAARLAAAGAAVVKIEPPGGDPLAEMSPPWYAALHEGVTVQRLDLKAPDGQRRLHALLSECTLLLTSQRPAGLARLSLAPADLTGHFPKLRHLNIVGDTRHPDVAGHDLTYQAARGLVDGQLPRTLLADLVGAERAVAAALLLLLGPEGRSSTVGLADSLETLTAPFEHGLTRAGGLLGGGLPAYGVYAAREGQVAVAALEPHFRARLYAALDRPLDTPLTTAFDARTAAEWEAWAMERDLPIVALRPEG